MENYTYFKDTYIFKVIYQTSCETFVGSGSSLVTMCRVFFFYTIFN